MQDNEYRNENENRPNYDPNTGEPIEYRYTAEELFNENSDGNNTASQQTVYQQPMTVKQIKKLKRAEAKAAKKAEKAAKPRKSFSFKRGVQFVCAAVLFGAIAGSTMYGAYYFGNEIFPVSNNNIEIPTVSTLGGAASTSNIHTEGSEEEVTMNVPQVVKAAMPAVVAINGTITTSGYMYPYSNSGAKQSQTSGTGIIVGKNDTELLMVTNAHVVDGVNNLTVTFIDGKAVSATVKGSKADKDIAVIAVKLADISADTTTKIAIAELGDSSEIEVGESVVAIGNALGEGQSVTVGWVSALDRTITIENVTYSNLIMTDAAINPGNSGGALLNAKGQVIGINSAKYTSEEVEGMGYAIPVSSVKDIIDTLMNRETREKVNESNASYLGITAIDITSTMTALYGYPQGIMIQQVVEDSAAAQAGLTKFDIIVSFDGESITSFEKLRSTMKYYEAGETVVIEYYHIDNGEYKLKEVDVTLGHSKSTD